MRVAVIHDWLTGMRGGERCLEEICRLLPDAELFTLFYNRNQISETIRNRNPVTPSWSKLPGINSYYRNLLPFYPIMAAELGRKLRERNCTGGRPYDLILSISHCAAKNVPLWPGVPHLCYCLTPVRYLWDHYETYFAGHPLERLIRVVAKPLRSWDLNGARHVSAFVGISEYVRDRIYRVYGRDAEVVYPPVATRWLSPRKAGERVGDYFLAVNALVPYKNTDLIVQAFNKLGIKLKIVGSGPMRAQLRACAGNNIEFLERVTDSELAELYRSARGFVFAAEEDFGIAPVEAQASGCPVIALGKGGALETVVAEGPLKTGVLFSESKADSLLSALYAFLNEEGEFKITACLEQARRFSVERFSEGFMGAIAGVVGRSAMEEFSVKNAKTSQVTFTSDHAKKARTAV